MTESGCHAVPALERILYVDDDDDVRAIAELALVEIGGWRVRACTDGPDAVAALPGFRPQLLLIDLVMPGMDGPSTLRALRALPGAARLPAVFITALDRPRSPEAGADPALAGVIAKPFDPLALATRIEELWRAFHQDHGSR